MDFDSPRVRRIPPPPPPGFGDEEYYQLYGRPEDYHRYRQQMEVDFHDRHHHHETRQRVSVMDRLQLPQNDSYRLNPHRREPTYQSTRLRPHPKTRLGVREPSFERYRYNHLLNDEIVPGYQPTTNRVKRKGGQAGPEERDFKSHKVTESYESEGTPSLSGMDDTDESEDDKPSQTLIIRRNTNNKRDVEEDYASNSESQISEFSDEEVDEEEDRSDETSEETDPEEIPSKKVPLLRSIIVEKQKRVPIKERLGKRVTSPGSSKQQKRIEDLIKERPPSREKRKTRRQSKSPKIDKASRDLKRHRSLSRRGRNSTSPLESQKRARGSRGRPSRMGNLTKREMQKTHLENEKMLQRLANKQKDLLNVSNSDKNKSLAKLAGIELPSNTLNQSESPHTFKKRRKSVEASSTGSSSSSSAMNRRDQIKFSSNLSDRKSSYNGRAKKENPRKSPDRVPRKKSRSKSPHQGRLKTRARSRASSQSHKLSSQNSRMRSDRARPDRRDGGRRRRSRDRIKVTGMESTAASSKRERILLSRSRSCEKRTKSIEKIMTQSPDRWQHDKFQSGLMPLTDDSESAFGRHWTKSRTERSKERIRRSRSSSSSKYGERRRRRKRGSSSRSRRKRSSSYSSRSSSRLSSYSQSSASSGSVRRERRRHKAEKKKQMELAAAAGIPYVEEPLHPPPETRHSKDPEINMGLTGNLLRDTNLINGVVVKYSEPVEARKPKTKWRLYVFKGIEELPILYIHRQSAYLLGRDRKVADIPIDHPSCSKQHAVLQFRLVDYTKADGSVAKRVTPYVVDLDSANGTTINNKKIEPRKYVQLFERDILKFGFSSREYVLLHDQSKDDEDLGVD